MSYCSDVNKAVKSACFIRMKLIQSNHSRQSVDPRRISAINNNVDLYSDNDWMAARFMLNYYNQLQQIAPKNHLNKIETLTTQAKHIMEKTILMYPGHRDKTFSQDTAKLNAVATVHENELLPKFKLYDQENHDYETDEKGYMIYCLFVGNHKIPFTHMEPYSFERFDFLKKSIGGCFDILQK